MKTVKNYKCKCGYEGELEIDSNIASYDHMGNEVKGTKK